MRRGEEEEKRKVRKRQGEEQKGWRERERGGGLGV